MLKIYVALFFVFIVFACKTGNTSEETVQQELEFSRIENIKPRNVIFILADDYRFDFMGFTGKVPCLRTPHYGYTGG